MYQLKIATWNLARPSPFSIKTPQILAVLKKLDADVLILTETDSCIDFSDKYFSISSERLFDSFDEINYRSTENRTTVWSKWPIKRQIETNDKYTSICCEINLPIIGDVIFYGTIIGTFGRKNFSSDLEKVLPNIESIINDQPFLIAGDLNLSFSDNYFFTKNGRTRLLSFFEKYGLRNLTSNIPKNIDHIILTEKTTENLKVEASVFIEKDELSDHKGVLVTIEF